MASLSADKSPGQLRPRFITCLVSALCSLAKCFTSTVSLFTQGKMLGLYSASLHAKNDLSCRAGMSFANKCSVGEN